MWDLICTSSFPITVDVLRYYGAAVRTTHFQAVGIVVDDLGKQVIERPDYHRPSFVAHRSSPVVSARATALLIRLGVVVFRVGWVMPASVSGPIVVCPVAPPARVFRTGWVIIRGVISPSGIAVSVCLHKSTKMNYNYLRPNHLETRGLAVRERAKLDTHAGTRTVRKES